MRKSFAGFIFCLFIIVSACASFAFAQDSDDSDKKNELTMLAGFAPDIGSAFGGARRSSFAEVSFRYSRVLASNDNLALKYHIDAIPFAVIAYKRELFYQSGPNSFFALQPGSKSFAFGVTPVGFQLNFMRKKKVQPFLTAEAGLLIFNKPIPDDRTALFPNRAGKNLNFTLAGGGGLEFPTNSGRSYILGFKFHHISNASSGNINPGFDQNLFYFGYTFKKW